MPISSWVLGLLGPVVEPVVEPCPPWPRGSIDDLSRYVLRSYASVDPVREGGFDPPLPSPPAFDLCSARLALSPIAVTVGGLSIVQ